MGEGKDMVPERPRNQMVNIRKSCLDRECDSDSALILILILTLILILILIQIISAQCSSLIRQASAVQCSVMQPSLHPDSA